MGVGVASWFCFKGGLQTYARTVVAALWDFEVLHSCLLSLPDGLENGVGDVFKSGPAIEWGYDESIHGRPGITVPTEWFYEMVL